MLRSLLPPLSYLSLFSLIHQLLSFVFLLLNCSILFILIFVNGNMQNNKEQRSYLFLIIFTKNPIRHFCFYLFCPMGFYHYPLFLFKGDLELLFMWTRFFRSSALFYLIFYVTTFCTLLATIFYYRTAARCIFFMCPDYSTYKRMAAYRLHTYIFF